MFWDVAAGAFGVVAAILAVGGHIFLRYKADKQRFALLQLALERGQPLSAGMDGPPLWLRSLRGGIEAAVLGAGLLVGGIIIRSAAEQMAPAPMTIEKAPEGQPDPKGELRRPPPPNLVLERWHLVAHWQFAGLLIAICGGLLVLLGLTRVVLANVERSFSAQATPGLTARAGAGSEAP